MRKVRSSIGVIALTVGLAGCFPNERVFGPEEDYDDDDSVDGALDGGFKQSKFDGRVPERDAEFFSPRVPALLQGLIVADTPPPPLSGGTLAVAADGSIMVAADPDRDLVYVIRRDGREVRTVELAKGSEPGRVALDADGRAHIALRVKGSVISIDLASASVIAETPVCSLPRGIAYDAKANAVLIACASGELVTLAAADHAPLANKQLALDLRDVVIGENGRVSVSRYRSAELLHLGANGELRSTSAPLNVTQARFVGDAGITDGTAESTVTMSPALAWKTVSAHDGSSIMLHQESQDDEVVIQQSGGYGGGCQTITQASLTRYDADGNVTNTVTLAPHGLVVDVAVSPDGKWLAVAEPGSYLQGNATFEVLPASDLQRSPTDPGLAGLIDAGTPPPVADGGFPGMFAPNTCLNGSGAGAAEQVTAVAFDAQGKLYTLSREPAVLTVYDVEGSDVGSQWPNVFWFDSFVLASSSVRDTGHELFHADVGSGLSCAGCHGEALDDGHVWNFRDFGPRRTQTMRGGLLSTLPLHWEGDLPTFKHLIDEVMTRRMGGFVVEQQYGDALAQWLDKLPPLKLGAAERAPADAVVRGKALFDSPEVACATCHGGPHFTNNLSFDVGTGGLFQVPILNGLALHPPFMHDGCAATLLERFDPACGGGDRHGHTSQLTEAQLADLVAYLQTL